MRLQHCFLFSISIHSLRMEGDLMEAPLFIDSQHFNPLPPHGGRRPRPRCSPPWTVYFNPLPPHGGRREWLSFLEMLADISIHSLRMEGDPVEIRPEDQRKHFNPLPPHGGRQIHRSPLHWQYRISIHSLRMEGDIRKIKDSLWIPTFQSTPSAWRETLS